MIKDLILHDISAQRAMVDRSKIIRRIDQTEKDIEKELRKEEDKDYELIAVLRSEISSLIAEKGSLSKEMLEFQVKKDAKLKDLKGSREQRFKQIEETKKNLSELIKELDTYKKRKSEGIYAEKMKIASEKIARDWNVPMKYEDGTYDKPFLSPEGEMEDQENLDREYRQDREDMKDGEEVEGEIKTK
jgi:hypothetical protein